MLLKLSYRYSIETQSFGQPRLLQIRKVLYLDLKVYSSNHIASNKVFRAEATKEN